jgi:hypothetical protein
MHRKLLKEKRKGKLRTACRSCPELTSSGIRSLGACYLYAEFETPGRSCSLNHEFERGGMLR